MRNKGFFWFLTIVLTAVCVYQLSFTWVTLNVEEEAEQQAIARVEEAIQKAKSTNNIYVLPNNTEVDFSKPESYELAKAAFLNEVLKEKAESPVYPVLGTKFKDVKARSLAFGLDLVGGMSVTLEISVPDLIKSYARNQRDLNFRIPFDRAYAKHTTTGGDFIDLFIAEYEKKNPNRLLVKDLSISEVKELSITSTNADVEKYFREKVSSSMEGVEQIMSKRINQFGVAQPNIQKEANSNRLYIELPGVQDEATVAAKLQSTANLQLYETYSLAEFQRELNDANLISKTQEIKVEEVAVDTTTVAQDTTGKDSLKLANKDTAKKATPKPLSLKGNQKGLFDYLKVTADTRFADSRIGEVLPENKDEVNAILRRSDVRAKLPADLELMWSAEAEKGISGPNVLALYAIRMPADGKAPVGGSDIKNAGRSYDQTKFQNTVSVSMTIDGSEKWAQMTERNVNRQVAITMDNVVYSAPTVNEPIRGGNTEISGSFSIEDADDLAGLLNGGALPAPCVIKEQTKVGPTIGQENSKSGLISFAFAFLAVFIYMYFYYGKGGLIANVALLVNVVLIFGCLASFGAVLTMAGIAGIVLTIGTAVDANILIFERVKEEQALGKATGDSVGVGFIKAMPAIIDANMTHILSAVILKIFGTGEIESFATTLIVGVFTSVFSAIVISKLLITSMLEKGKEVTFSTGMTHNLFKNFNFDWVGKRKYFYIFSLVITVAGVGSFFARGLKQSVEFTGGRTFGVKIEKTADVDFVEEELSKVFVEKGAKDASSVEVKTKSNSYNLEITTNYLLANDAATAEVTEKLKEGLDGMKDKIGGYEITDSRAISASVSEQMWTSATQAIILALLAIFAYILIRFGQWQYSLGAIIGLVHDVLVVLSVFSLLHGILPFNMDVNQAFIAAILTVIGYSMNDTVIVFDRIRENLNIKSGDENTNQIINDSLNKTLSRTFNTSMILFVVLLVMFIFGGPSIKGFLFALLVGVVIGTYSSLCVATPILVDFTKSFKRKAVKAKAK